MSNKLIGLLHLPHHLHEHRCAFRHQPNSAVRQIEFDSRVDQIEDSRIQICPHRRAIDDYDYMGLQDLSAADV